MQEITLSFSQEQRIALLKAMNVPDTFICSNVNISPDDLEKLLNDETFQRIINVYKDELEQENIISRFRENPELLDYWLKKKMINMINIIEQELDYVRNYIFENRDNVTTKEFSMAITSLSNLSNVMRSLLKDLSQFSVESEELKVKKAQAGLEVMNKTGNVSKEQILAILKGNNQNE